MFTDFLTQPRIFFLSLHRATFYTSVLFSCGTFYTESAQWVNGCPHDLKVGSWKCNWDNLMNLWA